MAICKSCGAENHDGAKFCEKCGAKLDDAPANAGGFCANCGTPLNGANFCPKCGMSVEGVAPQPAPNPYGPNPYGPNPYAGKNGFAKPIEKCSLVRRLLANIGSFVFIGLLVVSLMVELTKGEGNTFINAFKQMIESFQSSASNPQAFIGLFLSYITYLLPAIGVPVFGIIAIVKGIQSLINKNVPPSYGVAGGAIGFMLPYYLPLTTTVITHDNQGFAFDAIKNSPSFTIFLIALLVYVGIGLANAFMAAIENGKGIVSPILKAVAAACLIAAAIFVFCPSVATTIKDSSYTLITESDSVFVYYALGILSISYGSSFEFQIILVLLMGIMQILATVEIGLAIGSIVGQNKKNAKVTPFVMALVSNGLNIATVFILNASGSGSGLQMALPSIAAFVVIGCLLMHLIIGNISAGKDAAGV